MSAISTGLRAFFGSNEERGQARSKVMSMQLRFGQPAIFLTISPSSSLSYRVANLAGSMVDDLLDETTVTLQDCLAYTNARLGEIATSNPAACASYFNCVMEVLVEVILNWDVEKQCSKPGQGLFGITEAFFSSTEAQGSTGNLHAHMLIWVRGAAKTVDEYYASCCSNLVKQNLVQYVESIASSSFPIKPAACPKCGQTSLAASSFPAEAYQKPRKNSNRPVTSTCSHCSFSFGADDLIRMELNRVATLHQIEQHDWDDQAVRHFLAVPCSYPLPSSTRFDLVACRALIEYQVHHWYHCRSCFKRTRRTPDGKACRMFFPKQTQTETEWRDDKVELRRDVGSEYLNTYIPLLSAVFKCNHDVKFLAASEGPEKAYYMMKYTTKGQKSIENLLAIHLHAFDKAKLKMAECDNAIASGRRCVQSMCCSMSNAQEVSAPLAALYLERKSPFYSSTDFQRLHLASAVKTVFENADVDVILSSDDRGATFKLSSLICDYIYRPVEVEDVCLFDFSSLWEKKKNTTGFRFDNRHTQHQSHSLHKRDIPVTLWLLGKRLPEIRGQLVPDEEKLYFARSVLILFHPFRSLDDFFIDSTRDINARFDHWWEHDATEEAHLFVSHSNDYFASKRLARQCVDSDMIRYRNAVEQNVGGNYSSSDESESDNPGSDFGDGFSSDEDTATLQRSDTNIRLLNLSVAATTLAASSTESPGLSAFQSSCTTLDEVDECIANAERNFIDRGAVPLARTSTGLLPVVPTQVLLVQNAIADAELWIDPTTQTSVIPEFAPPNASLRCISTRFSLNRKQHKAFVRIGSPFLRSLVEEIRHSPGQVISFLGGPPGAGKSQVIRALQALAASWNCSGAIATVAYQGVAAEAAGGQTIHKFFRWGIGRNGRSKQYTAADKEQYAGLKLLIMDETSTTDAKLIGMMDIALRDVKNQPDLRFGGIHMQFAGDWMQQYPVLGHPAFKSQPPLPTGSCAQVAGGDDPSTVYLLRQRGIDAYREINEVVLLEENMRHRNDPQWRDILARWRFGEYTQQDIDTVNKCCFRNGTDWPSVFSDQQKAFCPILVTSNALRVEFNEQATLNYCTSTAGFLHQFPANVSRSRVRLTRGQRRSLNQIRSDKTGNLAVSLMLAIGLPVQCTKNISRALHLANGTIGNVVGFDVAADDRVRVVSDGGVEVHIHSKPANVVFIRLLPGELRKRRLVDRFPDGIVPVRLHNETGVRVSIRKRTFSLRIQQTPLIPAFALTTEKCQGLTVGRLIIGPMRHHTRKKPQASSFYVAVTRVKSMNELFLMEPLTLELLEFFKPEQEAIDETRRLQLLETQCDHRHASSSG